MTGVCSVHRVGLQPAGEAAGRQSGQTVAMVSSSEGRRQPHRGPGSVTDQPHWACVVGGGQTVHTGSIGVQKWPKHPKLTSPFFFADIVFFVEKNGARQITSEIFLSTRVPPNLQCKLSNLQLTYLLVF